jgi:SAM-dependent methyltransferase
METTLLNRAVRKLIPRAAKPPLERIGLAVSVLVKLGGGHPRSCPICGFHGRFVAFGNPPRYDARCGRCGSLERHRLLRLWLERELDDQSLGRVLHFAPEPALTRILSERAAHYLSADIEPGKGDLVLDLERIALPSGSVDTLVCSHVLEHVNDEAALQEMFRVLAPGGLSVLMVPVVEGWAATYENPSVSGAERTLHFGQADHVRYYGADFRERVRRPGFILTEFTATEPDVSRFGLVRGEKVFVARKP